MSGKVGARCPLPVARCPLPVARCPLPVGREEVLDASPVQQRSVRARGCSLRGRRHSGGRSPRPHGGRRRSSAVRGTRRCRPPHRSGARAFCGAAGNHLLLSQRRSCRSTDIARRRPTSSHRNRGTRCESGPRGNRCLDQRRASAARRAPGHSSGGSRAGIPPARRAAAVRALAPLAHLSDRPSVAGPARQHMPEGPRRLLVSGTASSAAWTAFSLTSRRLNKDEAGRS
jgi:hypothetical protein